MKKLLWIFMLLLFTSSISFAQGHNEVFNFTRDYITSLGELKLNAEIENDSLVKNKDAANFLSQMIEQMKAQRVTVVHIVSARSLLLEYRKSSNSSIAKTAEIIADLYQLLMDAVNQKLEAEERLINENEKTFNQEKYATIASASQPKVSIAQENFMQASVIVAYLLVSSDPDPDEHYSFLNITFGERKELINKLHSIFGSRIDDEKNKFGFDFMDASGAIMMKFLNGKHKSADERAKQ